MTCPPLGQTRCYALDCLLQTRHRLCISKAHMLSGTVATKINPWCEGHVLLFQKITAKLKGITTKSGNIRIQVKRPLRLNLNLEAQFTQCWQQIVATGGKLCQALLKNLQCGRGKAGQCSMLRHGWGTDKQVLRQFFQLGHGAFWRHQPAQSPACHAKIFRKAVQHKGLDRKSTRLNSSHVRISYAVFCLKKK